MSGEIDLDELQLRLQAGVLMMAAVQKTALDEACTIIEKDAKKQIGKYQPKIGPFPDWPELAESTQEQREKLGYPANEPLLREGDLRDSITHDVAIDEAVVGSKSDIAAYQEFGTVKIPPRPFLGPAVFKTREKVERALGRVVVAGLFGGGQQVHPALGYDMELGGD